MTSENKLAERLTKLRQLLRENGLSAYLVPLADEYQGEYVPACTRRLEWLTGFSGSAGMAVALATDGKSGFFTDGRYTIQAEQEVGNEHYLLFNSGSTTPESWLKEQLTDGGVVGYDPKLHTQAGLTRMEKVLGPNALKPVDGNLIDRLWDDRPAWPNTPVIAQELKYSGKASPEKREEIAAQLRQQGLDMAVITAPDSIAWLLNIRAADVPYTPFPLCTAILNHQGQVRLYIEPSRLSAELRAHLGNAVEVCAPADIEGDIAALGKQHCRVALDSTMSSVWYLHHLRASGAEVVDVTDPCQLPKACKNAVEIDGTRAAHTRDGLAVTRFLCWLDSVIAQGIQPSEIDAAEVLESLRAGHPIYRGASFTSISGGGANGAIVHYRATPASARKIAPDMLYLIDSGGQYPDGTTDITRTVAIGTPTAEQKDRFTRVLKGHIAIARAVFPEGTSGTQLDILARNALWQAGLDYDHGTGHGVGSYLSVHEGPQRISKRGGDQALKAGMILSNEPGYYKTGEYGIRIENLVLVVPREDLSQHGRKFFGFETLTLAPIDTRLVAWELLGDEEKAWLAAYHQRVYDTHVQMLSEEERVWLEYLK